MAVVEDEDVDFNDTTILAVLCDFERMGKA